MNALDVTNLEGEFLKRARDEKAAGDLLAASTWQLAAAMLVNAQSAADDAVAPLMTAAVIAPLIGLDEQVVRKWKREGLIPAAIDEPQCVRFDLAAVRAALAARAAKKASLAA